MNTYDIDSKDSIGNSLSSTNINYSILESQTFNIQASADTFWYPMFNYYQNFKKFLKEATSISQNFSATFINTATIVEMNSASWIKPITIFYPSIAPYSFYEIENSINSLLEWAKIYFPVYTSTINSITSAITTKLNYVENQRLIVYAHSWQFGSKVYENTYLMDQTLCQSQDSQVCVYCTDRYSGHVECDNGDFNCSGNSQSCSVCQTLKCTYKAPPYIPVGGTNGYGRISANVTMSFQDRNELENIKAVVFKISNCDWIFEKFLA